jgi:glycine/D-amino acid oxidase-like deaminating enzyme
LLSRKSARVDPYRMASRLLQRLSRDGVAVHDRTTVVDLQATSRRVVIETGQGARIIADHAIVAAGYAAQQWIPERVATNHSSYAFISDPLADGALGRLEDTIVWETARPYLYLRSTEDGRVLVGGADDRVDIPSRRDRRVESKARKLVKRAEGLLPHLAPLTPAFAWAGTFAETRDGLPFFGPHPSLGNRVLFAMAYGGNGITYSALGGALLRAHVERRAHPLKRLFGFERLHP